MVMKTSDLSTVLTSLFTAARDKTTGGAADAYSKTITLVRASEMNFGHSGIMFLSDVGERIKAEQLAVIAEPEKSLAFLTAKDMVNRLYEREVADLRIEAVAA